jgi:hypothetical protein
LQYLKSPIPAAIVNKDHLCRATELIQSLHQLFKELHQVLFFVEQRNYHGEIQLAVQ